MSVWRLLYLSFAFPPGLHSLHPAINPAGHGLETQMIAALRAHVEIRSVGMMPFLINQLPAGADPASGIAHDLLLVDQAPELWSRIVALSRLKRQYRIWNDAQWQPDAVLVYNLSPVYNQFIRWLRRQANRPKLVLLLLDSTQLGTPVPPWKQFRYHFKPFVTLDEAMLDEFDACIGLSTGVKKYADERGQPFLWMPGACTPARARQQDASSNDSSPLRFGYFGALGAHSGVLEMLKVFLRMKNDSELHLAGYGKQSTELAALLNHSPRIRFHGLLQPAECLKLGQSCDVLVNPRPPGYGNQNNIPSKLFEYALCERAIVASRMSGIDAVLGPEAFYFEPDDYEANLLGALEQAAKCSRAKLHRRGAAVSKRVKTEFNWTAQAARMDEFLQQI